MMSEQPHHDLKKGILLILVSWLFFSTSYLIAKVIGHEVPIAVLVFFRSVAGIFLSLPFMLMHPRTNFKIAKPLVVFVRAIVSVLVILFIFMAIQRISLVDATLLANTAPFFVPFMGALFFKHSINHKLWLPIIIGFIGIVFILKPNSGILNWGAIYGLLAGIGTGISLLCMRMMAKFEKASTSLFYLFFINTLCILPFAIYYWHIPSLVVFFLLLSMGILAFLGQLMMFKALQYGDAQHISPFGYTCVIYAGIFDWAFFGILPDLFTVIGVLLVTLGGIWVIHIKKPLINT